MATRLAEGQYTTTVYTLIKEQKYTEASKLLQVQLQSFPSSRAALSLQAYSTFMAHDFETAAECYAMLIEEYPEEDEYKLNHAQALYKGCAYEAAMQATLKIDNSKYQLQVVKLQAAIKYEMDDISGARALTERLPSDDLDTVVNEGCLLYGEGRYADACGKYMDALTMGGYSASVAYNVALCHYRMAEYAQALKHIADIIDHSIENHPELGVGMSTEGMDVRSVGNTKLLQETALVETFNLKAAIEYDLKNHGDALDALSDMPWRAEEELDPVTLHNHALMNMDEEEPEKVELGFEKLHFLLQQNPCPPETFGNLLLLYCKHQLYDQAADVLAENAHLTHKLLTSYLHDFLSATITRQTSAEEAFRKFDAMNREDDATLTKISKKVEEARGRSDEEAVAKLMMEYDIIVDRHIPVVMAQAKIYWDLKNYPKIEKIFKNSVEHCNEHDAWKLNVAHVLFMQEKKYKEAIAFYEQIVQKYYEHLLDVSAVALANLCVAFIMTSQNQEAEELMRAIEREEEEQAYEDPDRRLFHYSIINLVLGTLYCSKNNYTFGIGRVMTSLQPYDRKLGWQTWFYAKRCFLSLIEGMAKHTIVLPDENVREILLFFDACEEHGKGVSSVESAPLFAGDTWDPAKHTVAYEARYLKFLFQKAVP